MTSVRLALLVLACVEGGWMTFDGTRAMVVGDYVTPSSGVYAGQLGPWNRVVQAAGIPPRSAAMKVIFVAYGLAWLTIAAGFASHAAWSSTAMLVAAVATLWYLPLGTAFAIVQVLGILWLRRSGAG